MENKIVSIDDYMELCKNTAVYPNLGNNMVYVLLGLLGECGEVSNQYKKCIRDDNYVLTDERRNNLISEISDVFWYAVMCCYELGVKPSEVLYKNIKKLNERVANNTIKGSGDNR